MTLTGLGGLLGVTTLFLVHAHPLRLLGVALIGAGVVCALAAGSRHRYAREVRAGFAVLDTRDGRFVLGSAAGFAAVAVLVLALVLA